MARRAYCRICRSERQFTRCWMRSAPVRACQCCAQAFEAPAQLYRRHLPVCPRCAEPLEQPTFEYGLCDGCGSKFELTEGAVPSLLPNKTQRAEMSRYGKAWSPD